MQANLSTVLMDQEEINEIQQELGKASLMGKSLEQLIIDTDNYMALPLDVPGHSPAGGYAHNKHQQNGKYIDQAGRLFLITGDEKYAQFTANLLMQYADKYLKLGFQEQRNTNPPGRLFHQLLNEHVWLLYASLGYSCISHWLSATQRQEIIARLFIPLLDMSTVQYDFDFDRIHNHGIWAVASVAICGAAIGQDKYIDMSIHGLKGDDEEGGFLAQISKLFAPSGYYMEGPYYHRYAIRPLAMFAELVHRFRPELDIFNFKDQVIGKTIQAMLSTAYPNGVFPALNDASKTMDIKDEGVIIALSLFAKHYPENENILGMAKIQERVWVNGCGLVLSKAYEAKNKIEMPCLPSVELNEGRDGDKGAQGFIRMQNNTGDISQLVMNYGQHGMDHGHFDTLGLTYFNNNQEVLREYGFGRWVNVEPKFGGRYLDENKSYARQTIAHNLVTVDAGCQNSFDINTAEAKHGEPHFFIGNGNLQGMSAYAHDFYPGVTQQRTLLLVNHEQLAHPLLIDLFRLSSEETHQYDYALQYEGQIVRTNVELEHHNTLNSMGNDFGYQHLWNVAQGKAQDTTLVSWLQGQSYYTWLSASSSDDTLFCTRTGANDPSFNLRSETSLVLRRQARNSLFASVIETHGYFNEAIEASLDARGKIQHINIIGFNDHASIIEVYGEGIDLTIMVNNAPDATVDSQTTIEFNQQTYSWQGFLAVESKRS
ncbi:chondroitin lyase [Psychromonas sp. psych-6C06]|uniref:heparinase II/III domain-containing protein n=1 Tax=Psychromonas sp. psych-6C06 TaxID=2058089 RepID=UPI000C3458E3|nr:heparinase II/III family protein [Psychromonas sp. psych-6C06]PKF60573.1 chondroitin lyase [Psychromonas sp. psych-6C06]